jgi:zinc D-Ala-D-Ala carboxypeptidase
MTTRQVQDALRRLGWPITADGVYGPHTRLIVRAFQQGFAFYPLAVDGKAGPQTHRALSHSVARDGRCSPNFSFREFKSKGNGDIRVHRALILGLEEYRRLVRQPVTIVSGYRDPAHNRRVGGATNSQHLYGTAVDLWPVASLNAGRGLRRFSGIGYQGATGLVRHVDVRSAGPNNTTGGTPSNPTVWRYA